METIIKIGTQELGLIIPYITDLGQITEKEEKTGYEFTINTLGKWYTFSYVTKKEAETERDIIINKINEWYLLNLNILKKVSH